MKKKKKNPPVFPLLHTVFIDPVVINFSSIYSNKDLEVSETSGNLLHAHWQLAVGQVHTA